MATYQPLELKGRGGMAEVWRGQMTTEGGASRPVALKFILPHLASEPELLAQFRSEAQLSMRLSHGNVVQVFDFGQLDGRWFLAMEWVDGASLWKVLERAHAQGVGAIHPALAAQLLVAVLDGLHHAHTRVEPDGTPLRLVHRDVSPDNVLVGWDGQVKVADFGIARAAMAGRNQTRPGIFKGKLAYGAPEQARAEAVDARADVYAAGVMLWELVTGHNPVAQDAVRIAAGSARISAFDPALVDEAFASLVDRAVAAEPDHRFPSAKAFRDALAGWLRTQPSRQGTAELMAWLFPDAVAGAGQRAEGTGMWLRAWRPKSTGARPAVKPSAPSAPAVTQLPAPARAAAPEAAAGGRGSVLLGAGGLLSLAAMAGLLIWARSLGEDPTRARPVEKGAVVQPPPAPVPKPQPAAPAGAAAATPPPAAIDAVQAPTSPSPALSDAALAAALRVDTISGAPVVVRLDSAKHSFNVLTHPEVRHHQNASKAPQPIDLRGASPFGTLFGAFTDPLQRLVGVLSLKGSAAVPSQQGLHVFAIGRGAGQTVAVGDSALKLSGRNPVAEEHRYAVTDIGPGPWLLSANPVVNSAAPLGVLAATSHGSFRVKGSNVGEATFLQTNTVVEFDGLELWLTLPVSDGLVHQELEVRLEHGEGKPYFYGRISAEQRAQVATQQQVAMGKMRPGKLPLMPTAPVDPNRRKDAMARAQAGAKALAVGNLRVARLEFNNCMLRDSSFPGCYAGLAETSVKEGDFEQARDLMRRYLNNFPEGPYAKTAQDWLKAHPAP